MTPTEITFFAVTLFLALVSLITWKYRRDATRARLNNGLRGYVAAGTARAPRQGSEDKELLTA
ncbi:MAG: hypothetical protein ABI759_27020 [Candidatus Solibacter sp.]